MYLVPPLTFHQLKIGFRSVCINKIQEQNKVTGKNLLKDCFGRKYITIAHNTTAFAILKKFAMKVTTLKFFIRMCYLNVFIQKYNKKSLMEM
jgi:hypothetical protein